MSDAIDKRALELRLARCLELAAQFPTGPTAEMLEDLELELRDQLRTLEAKQTAQENVNDQRELQTKLRRKMI